MRIRQPEPRIAFLNTLQKRLSVIKMSDDDNMMDDEDYEFDYEDSDQEQDDGQVDMENEYYTAKGKSKISIRENDDWRSCCDMFS